jgi:hypothetical protein
LTRGVEQAGPLRIGGIAREYAADSAPRAVAFEPWAWLSFKLLRRLDPMTLRVRAVAIGCAALAAAGVALILFGSWFIIEGDAIDAWPTTDGEVVSVTVRSRVHVSPHGAGSGSTARRTRDYYPSITYRWTIDGQSYTGSRYALGYEHPSFETRQAADAAAAAITAGSRVRVHYDPADPASAVLDREARQVRYIPLLLGLLFAVTGGALFRYRAAIAASAGRGSA